jgi:hypothetical protein
MNSESKKNDCCEKVGLVRAYLWVSAARDVIIDLRALSSLAHMVIQNVLIRRYWVLAVVNSIFIFGQTGARLKRRSGAAHERKFAT